MSPAYSPTPSTVSYSPSFSTMMEGTIAPFTIRLGSIALTVPDTEQITFAEINPSASPIFCPAGPCHPLLPVALQVLLYAEA